MRAKDAITQAKNYVQELFGDEKISDLGLEEIVQEHDRWDVTVGFSRPWEVKMDAHSVITGTPTRLRSYKKVRINDADGSLLSIENRD